MLTAGDSSDSWDFTDEDFCIIETPYLRQELVANLHALKACNSCHHLLCCRAPSVHCPGLQAPASSIEQISFSKNIWNLVSGIGLIASSSNTLFNSYTLIKWKLSFNKLPATHCNQNKCLLSSGITSPAFYDAELSWVSHCWKDCSGNA